MEDGAQLDQLLKDFSAIPGKKVLVHGGGRRATQVASQLGLENQMVNGRRITDKEYAAGGNDGVWRSGEQEPCCPSAGSWRERLGLNRC